MLVVVGMLTQGYRITLQGARDGAHSVDSDSGNAGEQEADRDGCPGEVSRTVGLGEIRCDAVGSGVGARRGWIQVSAAARGAG